MSHDRDVRLAVEGLSVMRGERLLAENLAFSANPGEFLAVTGPNGAGKSSLLRVLAGLLRPAAGAVRLALQGQDLVEGEDRAAAIAYLGHLDALKPSLSARAQIAFFARMLGRNGADVEGAIARVGLSRAADLPARMLSAGQKRRAALARLLVSGRPLWLLDEPAASLDAQGKALLDTLLQEHLSGGGIAVAALHEPLGVAPSRTVAL